MRKGTAYRKGKEKRKFNREKVFELIKIGNGLTIYEISGKLNLKLHCVSGRLSELEQDGLIYQSAKVEADNRTVTLWKPTPKDLIELRKTENWNKRMVLWLQKGLNNGFINKKQFSELDKQGKLFG